MEFKDKLLTVQTMLKAPKDKYNSFGKYQYRSAEGILESVKPLLASNGLLLTLEDRLEEAGGRLFIRAFASIQDCETSDTLVVSAYAEIATEKKLMDVSQMTGTASSYARKYALNGLFLIDDTKDADTDEYKTEQETKAEKEPKAAKEPPKRKQRQEPKEDPYKDVANEKISAVKAKSLEGRLNAMNVNVSALLAKYGVLEVADLTEGQHLDIIEKLRKHEKK